ncbi:MAG: uroporphyrinogen-III C-methyltransferase [Gemmatimonadaceae bacterium]|nr:uroporphyrinogen-III C-methyltransferase [Gemmatimonadaceae bacterium]
MSPPEAPRGAVVSLVGAGPGDPDLLTVRARALLAACDAIVYDALVNPLILADPAVRRDAERHFVGKRGGAPSASQDEITALLVRLAREGKRVVRLKGGDPLVFGRGSEEAQALAAAGIPFEIVPGVTAGVAAPAYAGIPVTHRGLATSVTFVTGHEDPTKGHTDTDWGALARAGGTIVLYMGVKRLPAIVQALTAGGLAADTPTAAIEWGTYPRQRTVVATLGTIVEAAQRAQISAPSITVIGDVVRVRDEIRWFDVRPLHGRRVIVTRARAQASALSAELRALGAEGIEAPAIRIEPLDAAPLERALGRLSTYQWAIFTSQNAVELAWGALRRRGGDARAFAGVNVAAVGPATADALLACGLAVDVIPERYVAEGLIEALRARSDVRGARVLFARAEGARELLPAALREMGAEVDEVPVYRSVPDPEGSEAARAALRDGQVDLVTFTSGSTVRFFVDAVGLEAARRARVASIGPITSDAARSLGLTVDVEAAEATIPGLVRAVVDALRRT